MEAAFQTIDGELQEYLRKKFDEITRREAGSTATIVLVKEGEVICLNVGDSRAVMSRGGLPKELSTEHRVWGKGPTVTRETKRIKDSGAWVFDGRVCGTVAVSRAFGDWEWKDLKTGLPDALKEGVEMGRWDQAFVDKLNINASPVIVSPDISRVVLTEKDDVVVVASDGLWDVITSAQAVQFARLFLSQGMAPSEVAGKLIERSLDRETQDNVSVVVVDLVGAEAWEKGGVAKPKSGGGGGLFGGLFGKK